MKKIKLVLIAILSFIGSLNANNDCGSPTALTMNTSDCSFSNYNIGTATATTIANPCGIATHDDWFFEFTTTASQEVAIIRVGIFQGSIQFGGGTTPLFGELSIYTSCNSSPLYCVNLSEWTSHTISDLSSNTTYILRISYFDNPGLVSEEVDLCIMQPSLGEICESPFQLTVEEGECTPEVFDLEDLTTLNSDLPVSCGSLDYHDVYFEFMANSEEVNIQTGTFFELIEAPFIVVYEGCNDEVFCSTLSENNIYYLDNLTVGSNYQIRILYAPGGAPALEICVYEPCVLLTWFADADSDNYGDAAISLVACDQPMGYVANNTDCDDNNPNINPDADEVCNEIDDDCDGFIDDADPDVTGQTTWYPDNDNDGYGDNNSEGVLACIQPEGYVDNNGDFDDNNPDINPDADEICNGIDDDCDGLIDDDDPDITGQTTWYPDNDNDGFGDSNSGGILACAQPEGYLEDNSDCDDTNPNISPDVAEICNEIDDDCDGLIDDDDPDVTGQTTWYPDNDNDGFGDNNSEGVLACAQPDGYVDNNSDFDDNNPDINPDADEICNEIDDDCDGLIDDEDPDVTGQTTWYPDNDNDGYGDNNSGGVLACAPPEGHMEDNSDCDDEDENIHPGAVELCDNIDNNCDNLTDDEDPDVSGQSIWYEDIDNDGYGNSENILYACFKPENYVDNGDDCDDTEADVYYGAPELCDGMDNNCDGIIDENSDVEVEIQVQDQSIFFANAIGSKPPFTFLWSTGEVTQSIDYQSGITWVEVTDSLGCMAFDSIVITSISGQFESLMKVYPVPTHSVLKVEFSDKTTQVDKIEVFDIYGKLLYSEHQIDPKVSKNLDMSERPEGYYYLRVIQNGKYQIKEFIVVKE